MGVYRGICVAVVVRAAVEHVGHVNGALVAKTKLRSLSFGYRKKENMYFETWDLFVTNRQLD